MPAGVRGVGGGAAFLPLLGLGAVLLGGCAGDTAFLRADLRKGRIDVDGRLLEPCWQESAALGPFAVEVPARPLTSLDADLPVPGPPLTEAFLLWDEKHLYLAFFCPDDDLVARREGEHDEVEIRLRTGDPLASPLRVTVGLPRQLEVEGHANLAGVTDGGVEAATAIFGSLDDGGDIDRFYSVEARIPFAALGLEAFALSRPERIEVRLLRREISRGHRIILAHPSPLPGGDGAWADLLLAWD